MTSASRRPSRSGCSHRSCSRVDSGSGNDSATGPGPNTVPDLGGSAVIGRACSRCRSPSASTAHSTSCGPPKVRSTSAASRARRRRVGGRRALGVPRADLADAAAAVEDTRPAVDLARDELVGAAGDGGDDDAIASAGDGIGAEQHAAPCGLQHRLDEDGHVGVDEPGEAGPLGRAQHVRRGPRAAPSRPRRRGSSRRPRPSTTPRRPRRSTTSGRRRAASRGGRRRARRRRRRRGRAATRRWSAPRPGGRADRRARARARLAALAPTRSGRPAVGSSRVTTAGRAAVSTGDTIASQA